eukprot:5515940-Ditylum_brightwellii.AAC.2
MPRCRRSTNREGFRQGQDFLLKEKRSRKKGGKQMQNIGSCIHQGHMLQQQSQNTNVFNNTHEILGINTSGGTSNFLDREFNTEAEHISLSTGNFLGKIFFTRPGTVVSTLQNPVDLQDDDVSDKKEEIKKEMVMMTAPPPCTDKRKIQK